MNTIPSRKALIAVALVSMGALIGGTMYLHETEPLDDRLKDAVESLETIVEEATSVTEVRVEVVQVPPEAGPITEIINEPEVDEPTVEELDAMEPQLAPEEMVKFIMGVDG